MERDRKSQMSFDEYLDYLEEYWEIFGPPPEKTDVPYTNIKI